MNNNKKSNKMESMPIPKLIITMSIPGIVSMMIQALYNVVDSIFVSRISEDALTALSLAFPFQMLLVALGVGTGIGISSLISRRLGSHDYEAANLTANHAIIINLIYSIIIGLLGLFFSPYFFRIFTSDSTLINLGSQYIQIIMGGSFAIFLAMACQNILRGTGDTLTPMKSMIIGAVTNIILDPIMIFGLFGFPALGVRGAAIATILGRLLGALYILYKLLTDEHHVAIALKAFRFNKGIIVDIYKVALPSIIMQAMMSIMLTFFNRILIGFNTTSVAVLGIYYKLQSFVFMPVFGLTHGYIPILGYNFGRKNKDRMLETFKLGLRIAISVMMLGLIVFQLLPQLLMSWFTDSSYMISMGVDAFRKISLAFPLAAIGIMCSTTFQAMGYGFISLTLSFIRQLLLLLPCAWLLGNLFGLKAIWLSFIISESIALAIMIPLISRTLNKTFKLWEEDISLD